MNLTRLVVLVLVVLLLCDVFVDARRKGKKKNKRKSRKIKRRNRKNRREDQIRAGIGLPATDVLHRALVHLDVDGATCSATWVAQDCLATDMECVPANTTASQITASFLEWNTQPRCKHTRSVNQIKHETTADGCQFIILKLNAAPSDITSDCSMAPPRMCTTPFSGTFTTTRVGGFGLPGAVLNVAQIADTKSKTPVSGCINELGSGVDPDCHVCTRRQGNGDYRGTCSGDNGGPLYDLGRNIIGIADFVNSNCASTKKWNAHLDMEKLCPKIDECCSEQDTTTPEPVQTTPEPAETTPEPVQTTPEPVETTPEPVQTTPEPVQTTPELVQTTPEPVQTTPEPVQTTPEPVQTTPEVAPTTPVQDCKTNGGKCRKKCKNKWKPAPPAFGPCPNPNRKCCILKEVTTAEPEMPTTEMAPTTPVQDCQTNGGKCRKKCKNKFVPAPPAYGPCPSPKKKCCMKL